MSEVRVYARRDQVGPISGQRQQAFDQGSDGIGEGLQAASRGLSQLAQGRMQYLDKVDQATVADLDSSFADAVRQVERGFMSAQGRNGVEQAEAANKAWTETAAS